MSQADIFKILKRGPKSSEFLRNKLVPGKISEDSYKKNMQKMNKHHDIIKNDKGDYQINDQQ